MQQPNHKHTHTHTTKNKTKFFFFHQIWKGYFLKSLVSAVFPTMEINHCNVTVIDVVLAGSFLFNSLWLLGWWWCKKQQYTHVRLGFSRLSFIGIRATNSPSWSEIETKQITKEMVFCIIIFIYTDTIKVCTSRKSVFLYSYVAFIFSPFPVPITLSNILSRTVCLPGLSHRFESKKDRRKKMP